MKHSLPGVTGYNPPIWDSVHDSPRFTVAIAFTESGNRKFHYMGWADAIDGKNPRFNNRPYMKGYDEGLTDIIEEVDATLDCAARHRQLNALTN